MIYHVIYIDLSLLMQRNDDNDGARRYPRYFIPLFKFVLPLFTTIGILLDNRLVAFFDIDNTLYSANHKIAEAMRVRIQGK